MPRKREYMDPYVTVSRQRRWQLKRAALGECRQCGVKLPLNPYPGRAASYCPVCYGKAQAQSRKTNAARAARCKAQAAQQAVDDVI